MEGGTAAAKLRKFVPQIEALLQRGFRRDVIIGLLEQQGVVVNENYLSVFLTRERRARKRSEAGGAPPPLAPAVATRLAPPLVVGPAPAASAAIKTSDEQFAAALDPKKREAFADKYVNTRPPLFAAKAKGENQ